jgi:GT2 family glycosyltransferase
VTGHRPTLRISALRAAARRLLGRSPRAILRTLRIAWVKYRTGGIEPLLQQVRDAPNADEHDAAFQQWIARNTPGPADLARFAEDAATLPWRPRISVVTPVYNTDPPYLRACIDSVRSQVYPEWELCLCDDASPSEETRAVLREYGDDPRIKVRFLERNAGISAASNAALELATGEFVALLDHDDELTPDALYQVARFLNEHRDADMVYSDEDKLDLAGRRCDPYFKPDWSPEHFLCTMYTCHLMVVRRSLLTDAGGFRQGYEGAQDYDLVLRLMERTRRIFHLPRILYHWRKLPGSAASTNAAKPWALDSGRKALEDYVRRGGAGAEVLPGCAPGVFRMKFQIRGEPLVSIVIPTRGTGDLLVQCLTSLAAHTAYRRTEVIVVADQPISDAALHALQPLNARVIHAIQDAGVPGAAGSETRGPEFNFSRKINVGARGAKGYHLLLLNDDVEAIEGEGEWLSAMLEYSQQEEIGAVGAKLVYPDGRLQHVGILLGVCGTAAHAFHQHGGSTVGYASSALRPGNFSAVSAACMMTRRAVFDALGGFDERLPVDFNDVDYCLRARQAGYRTVFTPYAQLVHHEAASTGRRFPDESSAELIRQRWGAVLDCDPYYNPNLTRHFPDYRLPSTS